MSRILVSGSIAYDRIMDFAGVFSDHLMPDKLHTLSVSFTVERLAESFGGTAGNIAYTLALLGEQAELAGRVGRDFARYRDFLKEKGVGTDLLEVSSELPTAAAHIMTDAVNNQIAGFYPGPLSEIWSGEIPADASLGIVSASSPKDIAKFTTRYREKGIPFFLDPGQQTIAFSRDEMQSGIKGAAALFCNDYELAVISEKTGWSEEELARQVAALVVTLGAQGARIRSNGEVIRVDAVEVGHIVDPTGAGDAHRAGFAKGFLAKLPLKVCGQLASTVAAYAVETRGTQNHRFTMDELRERYHKAFGETLSI